MHLSKRAHSIQLLSCYCNYKFMIKILKKLNIFAWYRLLLTVGGACPASTESMAPSAQGDTSHLWLRTGSQFRVVSSEVCDVLIAQVLHEGLHGDLFALAVSKHSDLFDEILLLLSGETWPEGIDGDSRRTVARGAQRSLGLPRFWVSLGYCLRVQSSRRQHGYTHCDAEYQAPSRTLLPNSPHHLATSLALLNSPLASHSSNVIPLCLNLMAQPLLAKAGLELRTAPFFHPSLADSTLRRD